ncbi:MAG: alanine racemase [Firmicutes bacterium]|uniref:Alanine racemase n=1 Tax=Melghirimyces thermohalophilus TaxID=1236220 RepID=A0A1G6N6V2_9BACL|nr:alanine racemase [Melghirimyces thermohalophilus]MDA8352489.1 alanine racemase [Bacillota bacterium]SDC63559.1 alanine racemase [Melghirimyces thermohalophilus]
MEDKPRFYRDTRAVIDLDAIRHNVSEFRHRLPESCRLMATVKANAYGHGSVQVARAALAAGATHLAVAFLDEALELRKAGLQAPILTLGYTPARGIRAALEQDIALTVFDRESAETVIQEAKRAGGKARVHVKVDTGMGRLGIWEDQVLPLVQEWVREPHLEVEGLFTHFATADNGDKEYAVQQHNRLLRVIDQLAEAGIHIPLIHCANSAAAIDMPDWCHGMIRLGISMYGYYPSEEVNQEAVRLQPALTLKTRIVQLKRPPAGTGISYGKTAVTDGQQWIATLPVGYADGYSRLLSNRGVALVQGKRVPIIGRICMDQTMLDVTSAMPVKVGEEVVLYGSQGSGTVHVDEVADLLDTISYEVTCMIDRRVPRIYVSNGQVVDIVNPLEAV